MNYINIYGFLEDPEGSSREMKKENIKIRYSLNCRGLTFEN